MTQRHLLLTMSMAACMLTSASGSQTPSAAGVGAASLKSLTWMAGDWELREGNSCTEESWTLPADDKMIGMSRTIENGETRSFEFIRIEARADGIFYVAQPGGRPPVDFKLSTSPGPELTFLNPGHADHLKRILYRRDGDAGMAARIEGENNGKPFAADFVYRRAPSSVASRCGAVK
jgi:Domain of unknown function (DUF6265)